MNPRVAELAGGEPLLVVSDLHAGYGKMEILRGVDLMIAAGRSLCMIGPNGAGKSTVLHSIYGFTRITSGSIRIGGQAVPALSPNEQLRRAGIASNLQGKPAFPGKPGAGALWVGGHLVVRHAAAKD